MKYFKLSTLGALAEPARKANSSGPDVFGVEIRAVIAASGEDSTVSLDAVLPVWDAPVAAVSVRDVMAPLVPRSVEALDGAVDAFEWDALSGWSLLTEASTEASVALDVGVSDLGSLHAAAHSEIATMLATRPATTVLLKR